MSNHKPGKAEKLKNILTKLAVSVCMLAALYLGLMPVCKTYAYVTAKSATCVNTFVAETTEPTTEPTTQQTTEPQTDKSNDKSHEKSTEQSTEQPTAKKNTSKTSPGTGNSDTDDKTLNIILVCGVAVLAVIVSLSAKTNND